MAEAVPNVLLETLRDLLVNEVKFLSSVSNEVKKVEEDLRFMYDLLVEADAKRGSTDSPVFKNCITQLKDLAFRAENVLEKYAVEVQSKKEGKSLKKKLQRFMCILCECYHVHEVGNEVNGIRSDLASLTHSLCREAIPKGEARASDQEQRPLSRIRYAHEVEQHFVGMEKDIESVVSMVKDDSPDAPSLISICGMGGLGKTTLARKIYNHRDIKGHFSAFAWVCVTQQFQPETILKEIFEKIDGNKPDQMGLPALVERLHNVLVQKKKCFIVIDDIWEDKHWRILKPAFPKNCKILLTTRDEKVASDERRLHKLNILSEDEGWELLRKIAQVSESKSTSLESIGRKLVGQCGRLPLAISVIGGILRQKPQILAEWGEVSSNMDAYLKKGEGMGNDERVNQVLDLSFDVLPYYLKPCFLYLACFAEDEDIKTEELYLMWMAEGLIPSEGKGKNETLRDVAQRYLTELASRCMVQVEKSYFNTPHYKFTSCRLHDLMRELCSSKAEEEKFIKRVDVSREQQGIPSDISSSFHRLAICVNGATTLSTKFMEELKHLTSFLVLHKHYDGSRTNFENIVEVKNFKHLRILVLSVVELEDGNFLSRIGKLIHLKYMRLHFCNVKELPSHVCYLPYLHTLDLRTLTMHLKLPNLIWKMKRLRHLFLPINGFDFEVIGGDKLKLDGLNELETLEGVHSKCVCIEDVINLTNLRTLSVEIKEDMDSLSKIVDHMSSHGCQLRETYMYVWSCDLSRNVLNKMLMSPSLVGLRISDCEIGCSFPSYKQGMCPNLVQIYITRTKIEVDVMGVMGKFPMLQQLELDGEVFNAEKIEMRFGVDSFPELKRFDLLNMMNLYKWEVEMGAMPKLLSLQIHSCKNLERLPDGLRFISTLQEMEFHRMPKEFTGRYEREGQDYANFSHISIEIR